MTAVLARPEMAASLPPHVETWRRRHYVVLISIALTQMLIRAELPLGQDMLWGARSGIAILNTGEMPHADTYSWTAHGKPWIPNSWAWNVLLGTVYRSTGVIGFWLLGVALAMLMALTVATAARRLGANPLATAALYAPIGLLGLAAVPRAQTLSTIVVLALPAIVARAMSAVGRRAYVWITLLIAVHVAWMNLHSAALIGPVLVLACGSATILHGRWRTERRNRVGRLAVMTVGSAAACVLTPYGLAQLTHADEVRQASSGLVTEWDSIGFGSVSRSLGLVAVLVAVTVTIAAWRAGRADIAACIAVLAAATASAIRFLPMLAVFAAPEGALLIIRLNVRPRMWRAMVAATSAVLVAFSVAGFRDLRSLGDTVSPQLIAQIPGGCRLLNDDLAGDGVTLLRPDVLVSLDGRYDMYGRKVITEVQDMFADRPGTAAEMQRDRITCVLGPSAMPLVKRLSSTAGWAVRGHDKVRTLLVRAAGAVA